MKISHALCKQNIHFWGNSLLERESILLLNHHIFLYTVIKMKFYWFIAAFLFFFFFGWGWKLEDTMLNKFPIAVWLLQLPISSLHTILTYILVFFIVTSCNMILKKRKKKFKLHLKKINEKWIWKANVSYKTYQHLNFWYVGNYLEYYSGYLNL